MNQERIAKRIKEIRQQQGLTQKQFADKLNTSQSAVNRMESGKQNLSLEMLSRMSDTLGREIISVDTGAASFRVEGGHILSGEIEVNVSKNSAVGLLCATLLNKSPTKLMRMPQIEEVYRIIEVLESIGVRCEWSDGYLLISPPNKLRLDQIDRKAAERTRTIIMFLAPLMHREKSFKLPAPGGCNLGSRTIVPHTEVLEQFGLEISAKNETFHCQVNRRKPEEVILLEPGDTVTENALMAAALTPGKTTIKYASANYAIQDMCVFLQQLGVQVEGIGSTTMTVHGIKDIDQEIEYYPSEDPIEAMSFITIAIVTGSKFTIKRAPVEFLEKELLVLKQMGQKYNIIKRYTGNNDYVKLVDIEIVPSKLFAAPTKIHALPYPGINMDNLPFFAPIAAMARGKSLIHDWSYENRAIYFTELQKLNVRLELLDPHRVFIHGPTKFESADVVSPPALRPAMNILICMLAAPGTSVLRNVYWIARGYEDLATRLGKLGAKIEVF